MRIQSGGASGVNSGYKDSELVMDAIGSQMQKLQQQLHGIDANQKLSSGEKDTQKKQIGDQLNILRQQYTQRKTAQMTDNNAAFLNGGEQDAVAVTLSDGARGGLKTEAGQDAAAEPAATKRGLQSGSLSARIQSVLEEMAEESVRSADALEQARRTAQAESKSRGGHVDYII